MTVYFVGQALPTFETSSPTTPSTDMSASLVSSVFEITNSLTFALQFIWTGSPTGTLAVMGSLDGVNFNISMGTYSTAGAAGEYILDINATAGLQTTLAAVKGIYTFSSGTGALTSVYAAKKYIGV